MRLRVVARLLQIQRVLVRHGLDELILATHLFRPLRYAFYLSPATWFERRKGGPRGERIRLALEELGPIWVKLGQALSTRRDLLPTEIADELAKLQDRVPPFPGAEAKAIVEQAYGKPVEEVFESFDEAPLAAASIAQVHTARLRSGEEVVIKVVRPGVRARIERDLEVMYVLAGLARDYVKEGYRLRPLEVVQ
jgi:ubiquinone biosynthesis protein